MNQRAGLGKPYPDLIASTIESALGQAHLHYGLAGGTNFKGGTNLKNGGQISAALPERYFFD